MKIRERN